MLQPNYCSPSTAASSYQADRLSIDVVLARSQARLDGRQSAFPPDFLHGRVELGEIYGVHGARWVEEAVFIEQFFDENGEFVAWTVARFEDEFLSLEQSMRDEDDDFLERFAELQSERRRPIFLRVEQGAQRALPAAAVDPREMRCAL